MISIQNIDSLLSREVLQVAKDIALQPDQVVYGKIEKIYPNNTALVQIGGQKFVAELQVPITVNERYWFQVLASNEMLMLKVLDELSTNAANGKINDEHAAQQLIQKWGLSRNADKLLRFLLKEQLPIIKDQLLQATEWLSMSEQTDVGLQAIKLMYVHRLPFTRATFEAMKALQNPLPFSQQLANLKGALMSLPEQTPASNKLLQHLTKLTGGETEAKQIVLSLLETWLKDDSQAMGEKPAFSLLQKLNVLPAQTTETEIWEKMAKQLSKDQETDSQLFALEPNHRLSGEEVKGKFADALFRLHHAVSLEETEETAEQLRSLLSLLKNGESIDEGQIVEQLDNLYDAYIKGNLSNVSHLSANERNLLEAIFTARIDDAASLWDSTDKIAKMLKQIVQSLGLQYEANVQNAMKTKTMQETQFNELKPLLLHALEELSQPALKETIESLVHRITGQQLLAQEQGPIQQIFMQIPFRFGNHITDVTIQWQGKKQKSGSIDPNYCRILFYLDLQLLKETVIDVHIQNRVVNISIINETPGLAKVVAAMQPMLKASLEKQRYILSNVKVIHPEKEYKSNDPPIRFSANQLSQEFYSGVDYRV
jgi:hypothetical protein